MEGRTSPLRDARRSSDYLNLLTDLMEDFAGSGDLDGILKSALHKIREAMAAEAASLFLLDGELSDPRARLVCHACVGPSDITGLAVPAGAGIIGRAVNANEAQIVADVGSDRDFVAPPSIGQQLQVRSILCAPLSVRGAPNGAVEVINRTGRAELFDQRDRDTLAALCAVAALAISNARLARTMSEQERLKRELDLAAEVQRSLLPARQQDSAAVHGLSLPARGVSGDFYDILPLPGGRTAFAMADVSGKGMNAALVMVKAHTLFRSLGKRIHEPGKLLVAIERELGETMTHGMFVTMVVGVHDARDQSVVFSNAGHEPPLWRSPDGEYRDFPASDPPLGIVTRLPNNRYRETRLPLAGGSLYLFTDGVTEGLRVGGGFLGSAGLKSLIEDQTGSAAPARLEAIADRIAAASNELRDDLTLMVIEEASAAEAHRRQRRRRGVRTLVRQSMPAQAAQLKIVRRLVEAASRQVGAPVEWGRDFALAVDEACQNIIRHAYHGDQGGRIELTVRRAGVGLSVELVDFAPPVDQDKCRGRPLDELRPGGLGTHFMHALADRVRFLRPPAGAGNRLLLYKSMPKSVSKESA